MKWKRDGELKGQQMPISVYTVWNRSSQVGNGKRTQLVGIKINLLIILHDKEKLARSLCGIASYWGSVCIVICISEEMIWVLIWIHLFSVSLEFIFNKFIALDFYFDFDFWLTLFPLTLWCYTEHIVNGCWQRNYMKNRERDKYLSTGSKWRWWNRRDEIAAKQKTEIKRK